MLSNLIFDLQNFQIIKKIGEGKFGTVFLIEDKDTRIQYAAKVNKISSNKSIINQTTFFSEIETYLNVQNPTILNLLGFNMSDFNGQPNPTILMDFMPNGSLSEIIDQERNSMSPHDWTDTTKYISLLGIALGMQYLHSKSIIHRDLKPANILFDKNFYPRICDFGLSFEKKGQLPQIYMNTKVGTPLYMAPEIIKSDTYSDKVDVYSFALIAYEIITCERPKTPLDLTKIPGEKNQFFFKRCCSINPAERPHFDEIIEFLKSDNFMKIFLFIEKEDVSDFLQFYQEKSQSDVFDINNSILYLKKATNQGDPEAMYKYAIKLFNGEGIAYNKEKALYYIRMSAGLGNADAMFFAGKLFYEGTVFKTNYDEALRYFKMAAEKGHGDSIFYCARICANSCGVPFCYEEFERYIQMGVKQGHIDCIYSHAYNLYYGFGTEKNDEKAVHYYKIAADKGHIAAMRFYGFLLYKGLYVEMNKEEGARYYKMAADKGDRRSMFLYALVLKNGDGVEKNIEESNRYMKMAADLGSESAILHLSKSLNNESSEFNLNYYMEEANKGNLPSMYCCGQMLEKGQNIPKDKTKALDFFRKAAKKGEINSMYRYAQMLEESENASSSKKEAFNYYFKAANKNHILSMYHCAQMLEKGDGVQMNKIAAFVFYRKAAKKGHIASIHCCAQMLEKGEGIPMNINKAKKYYIKASKYLYLPSIFSFAQILENGEGALQNEELAETCYKFILEKGSPSFLNECGELFYKKKKDKEPSNFLKKQQIKVMEMQ